MVTVTQDQVPRLESREAGGDRTPSRDVRQTGKGAVCDGAGMGQGWGRDAHGRAPAAGRRLPPRLHVLLSLLPATKGNVIPALSRISFLSRSVKTNTQGDYSAHTPSAAGAALIPLLMNAGAGVIARDRNNGLTFGGSSASSGQDGGRGSTDM